MKWNIDHLPVFLAVAEMRGVTGAAIKLSMPKSTVSRILSKLEEDLDLRLFDRNSRAFRLTAEGEMFRSHAQIIMEQVYSANEVISGLRHTPSGVLKVSMPMAFSRDIISRHLAQFDKAYPDLVLQLMVTAHQVNLMREDLDLAFIVGMPDDSESVIQKIVESPLIWVTAPDYAARHDLTDERAHLLPHLRFCERRYATDRLIVKTAQGKSHIQTADLMSVNDPVILREIVRDGGGVALLPALYCYEDIAQGKLVEVFQDIQPEETATIYALMPSRRLQPQKARLFIEFVQKIVAEHLAHHQAQSL